MKFSNQVTKCPLPLEISFKLTCPNDNYMPSVFLELSTVASVASFVLFKFLHPKLFPRLWRSCSFTSLVAVPKTTMNENNCPVFRQNQVGFPRETRSMQSKAQACAVKVTSYDLLGFCILGWDATHHIGSFCFRKNGNSSRLWSANNRYCWSDNG